jgi:hypothetical protein
MTWSRRMIIAIICVAISYGIWFDYLDSLVGIGTLFGGNIYYQPWNIIGHFLPALFLLLLDPRKIEFFLAGFLISTAVMDLPVWGVERIYAHHGYLWLEHSNTYSVSAWSQFYYNPIGTYGVWGSTFPTAMVMFWSVVGRLLAAGFLIWYQTKIEKEAGFDVPLLNMRYHLKARKFMKDVKI